jgi:hypothetical protein
MPYASELFGMACRAHVKNKFQNIAPIQQLEVFLYDHMQMSIAVE